MSAASRQSGNALQLVGGALLAIWISDAFIAGLYHNYAQKRQCIQDDGWLKGWLWCSTETRNTFTFNTLRGLIWPIEIARQFSSTVPLTKQVAAPTQMTQKQFDTSRAGTVYSCWAVALRTDRNDDAVTFAQLLSWMKKKDPIMANMHSDYMLFAALHFDDIESGEGFESYYRTACADPVARMKLAISQGMMK